MRVNKTDTPLTGVKCVVNSCNYYTNGDHCSAEMIEIQPKNASDTPETDCATFLPKG